MYRLALIAILVWLAPGTGRAEKVKIAVLPTQFGETSRGQVPQLFGSLAASPTGASAPIATLWTPVPK